MDERNELVLRELPQVYYVAARIRERLPKHVEMEDLVQAGVIGLLDACRNYDSKKDAQFSTFAKHRIRGAILDSLRKLDWGSRTLRRKGREIASSTARLESRLGRYPSEEEIAVDLKMRVEELQNILAQLDGLCIVGQLAKVSASGGNAESFDLIESAPDQEGNNPLELCLRSEMKEELAAALTRLSERERLILSLYYYEELTMKEVAEVVGIAVSRVSQIHAAAMLKLRVSLAHLQHAPVDDGHALLQGTNRSQVKIQS